MAWRVMIKKKAQKIVDEHLGETENISPASSVREYVRWLKPNTTNEGNQDAAFMFSNGLEFEGASVRFQWYSPTKMPTHFCP
jgi:hypothetical protein